MTNKINDCLYYIGVNDHDIDLFEGQYDVPNGMAYNSYIFLDEKIAIFDTVDKRFFDEWISNVKELVKDRKPDYLIVQHMEPDHSANIMKFLEIFPDTIVVGNMMTFQIMLQFFGKNVKNQLIVKENDTLSVGKNTLKFVFAPMVHWPEVMMTYNLENKIFFSADAFGKFGALDVEEEWDCEARRYYIGIVGKYGAQVQNLLQKVSSLEIQTICPLHGPVLKENLAHHIKLYDIWSSYKTETDGVAIFYTSVYGHTKEAAELLKVSLEENNIPKIAITDLAREDMAEAVEDAFRYGKIVLMTTTYNKSIFPFMNEFLEHLIERNWQNKFVCLVENGSWSPNAINVMKNKLSSCQNIIYLQPNITIKSALSNENIEDIKRLAKVLSLAKDNHLVK
ncbi:MAG: FprA family A-type flavoprotein [Bacilli bacterium]|nr:FprA family A-type flavoprotein [Bacilli bacterium]